MDVSTSAWCSPQLISVAASEKVVHATRYPAAKIAVGRRLAVAQHGGDDAGQGIYPAYTVIDSVPNEYMPG